MLADTKLTVGPGSVRNLQIWREGIELVGAVYELTRSWPRSETYGLTSQVREAAVSIPANLAEGVGRGAPREIARYSQIALGSLYEVDTLLEVAVAVGITSPDSAVGLRQRASGLARRISSFIRYQRSNLR